MRADGRKEYEERRTKRSPDLELIESKERELIGDGEPAELGSVIREAIRAVDFVEAVKDAFRPRLTQAGHQRHRPESAA